MSLSFTKTHDINLTSISTKIFSKDKKIIYRQSETNGITSNVSVPQNWLLDSKIRVEISPNCEKICVSNEKKLFIQKITEGNSLTKIYDNIFELDGESISTIKWVELSPKKTIILVGSSEGNFSIVDGENGKILFSYQFNQSPLLKIKYFFQQNFEREEFRYSFFVLIYSGIIINVEYKSLVNFYNKLVNGERDIIFKCKRWELNGAKKVNDIIYVNNVKGDSVFDVFKKKTVDNIVSCGKEPSVGLFSTDRVESTTFSASKIATQVTSYLFSMAKNFWGKKKDDEEENKKKKKKFDIPSSALSSKVSFYDSPREVEQLIGDKSGNYFLSVDSLGRIMLVETDSMIILKLLKGYRECSCYWISSPPYLYFLIYLPLRGTVELWNISNKKREYIEKVDKYSKLFQVNEKILFLSPKGDFFNVKFNQPFQIIKPFFEKKDKFNNVDEESISKFKSEKDIQKLKKLLNSFSSFYYILKSLDYLLDNYEVSTENHLKLNEYSLTLLSNLKFKLKEKKKSILSNYIENKIKIIKVYDILMKLKKPKKDLDFEIIEKNDSMINDQWKKVLAKVLLQRIFTIFKVKQIEKDKIKENRIKITLKNFIDCFNNEEYYKIMKLNEENSDIIGDFIFKHLKNEHKKVFSCLKILDLSSMNIQFSFHNWILNYNTSTVFLLEISMDTFEKLFLLTVLSKKQKMNFLNRIIMVSKKTINVTNTLLLLLISKRLSKDIKNKELELLLNDTIVKVQDLIVIKSILVDVKKKFFYVKNLVKNCTILDLMSFQQIYSDSELFDKKEHLKKKFSLNVCRNVNILLKKYELNNFEVDFLYFYCAVNCIKVEEYEKSLIYVKSIKKPLIKVACCVFLWSKFTQNYISFIIDFIKKNSRLPTEKDLKVSKKKLLKKLEYDIVLSQIIEDFSSKKMEDIVENKENNYWFLIGYKTIKEARKKYLEMYLNKKFSIIEVPSFLRFIKILFEISYNKTIRIEELFQKSALYSSVYLQKKNDSKKKISDSQIRFKRKGFIISMLPEEYKNMLILVECFPEIEEDFVRIEYMKYNFLQNNVQKGKEILLKIQKRLKAGSAILEVARVKMEEIVNIIGKDKKRLHMLSEMDYNLFKWIMNSKNIGFEIEKKVETEEEKIEILKILLKISLDILSAKKKSIQYRKSEKMFKFLLSITRK